MSKSNGRRHAEASASRLIVRTPAQRKKVLASLLRSVEKARTLLRSLESRDAQAAAQRK
jgi:hypothetical protein